MHETKLVHKRFPAVRVPGCDGPAKACDVLRFACMRRGPAQIVL
jgi:hypothetical protein